jgi:DNA adenine methylase
MMIKSPLRYPGGKNRIAPFLSTLFPDYDSFYEPFVGGGSVFIHEMQQRPDASFSVNDWYGDLVVFWSNLKTDHKELVEKVRQIHDWFDDGRLLFNLCKHDFFRPALKFFILNRITFSGTIESGGYSQNAFEKRFTESCIERLDKLGDLLSERYFFAHRRQYDDYINNCIFKNSGTFVYLDPPYMLKKEKNCLYGKKGDLHRNFDHSNFATLMHSKQSTFNWLITLNDCPEIREMFDWANIYPLTVQYGMNNYKKEKCESGAELIITNYENAELCKLRVAE